jgi:PhoH-like ATPase
LGATINMKKTEGLTTPTKKLRAFRDDLFNKSIKLVIGVGLPFTGKTAQATDAGIIQLRGYEGFKKFILIRPVIVPKTGFLPGTFKEKMYPYVRQTELYMKEFSGGMDIEELMRTGRVEIFSTDLLQGNRFDSSYMLFDEMQNAPWTEAYCDISRFGNGSKIIFTGDISKGQANKNVKGESVLDYLIRKFYGKSYVGIHHFYDREDMLIDDEDLKDMIWTIAEDFL